MLIDNDRIHTHFDRAVVHLSHADTAYILIVVDGADQYLGGSIRVSFRRRNIFQDRLKERLHVLFFIRQIQDSNSGFGGSVYKRTVQLVIGGIQIHE